MLIAACVLGPLAAQITGGSFVGVVTDPSGSVLANAEVEAVNVGTSVASKTLTTPEG
jgi:hypothetical protein